MIELLKYESSHKKLWDDFIEHSRTPLFMHKRDYMEYHKDRFNDNSLIFFDNDEAIAVFPAVLSEDTLISHGGLTFGGLILSNEIKQNNVCEVFDALKQYCKQNRISTVLYKPVPYIYYTQPSDDDKYALFRAGGIIDKIEPATVISLRQALPMAKLRKRQVKKALKNNLIVQEFESFHDYETYINMLNEVLALHHNTKAVHTANEIFYLHEKFPNNIRLFMTLKDGFPIAGTIIFEYQNLVHTQYLASTDLGRQLGALDLLIYSLIETYQSKDYFDFGISTEENGSILNHGLISQKEGFGGRTVAYTTYRLNV